MRYTFQWCILRKSFFGKSCSWWITPHCIWQYKTCKKYERNRLWVQNRIIRWEFVNIISIISNLQQSKMFQLAVMPYFSVSNSFLTNILEKESVGRKKKYNLSWVALTKAKNNELFPLVVYSSLRTWNKAIATKVFVKKHQFLAT